jgi:serpin B
LKLTTANVVFVPQSAVTAPVFVERAQKVFDARIEAADFKSARTLERVNAWAKEATQGLIPAVIGQLDPNARFVLANAVYFSGAWEAAFDPSNTAKAPFTRFDGSTRDVAMMDATLPTVLAEVDDLQAVRLPYAGKDFAMFVIAPGEAQGPDTMAKALKRRSIVDLMAALQQKRSRSKVQVRLPRFRAEADLDLTDVLARLNLAPAFDVRSDYGAISSVREGPLQVTHKAVLEVTESGTKAAATTAVTSDRSLALAPVFSADRPFAFAIVHEPTQAILFAGYIADPSEPPR